MSSQFPGRHPAPEEVDALLDPAGAGSDQARAHVSGCLHCQEVSAGLVEVRRMLRDEAGRVPSPPLDLGARIAAALAEEPALARSGDTGQSAVFSLAQRRSGPAAGGASSGRRTRWLAVAAGLAVLAGTGLALSELLPQMGGQSEMSEAGGAADAPAADAPAEEAPAGAMAADAALATGTDYRPESLSAQVDALIEDTRDARPTDGVLEGTARDGDADQEPEAARGPGTVLADPLAWKSCLQAIGAPEVAPVAVDLARWQGRDAAVLVLPAAAGLEVWVVPPDCGPGSSRVEHQQRLDP